MIKDLKMGMKMLRYSYNKKANIVMSIIFLLLGTAMVFGEGFLQISMLGGYFLVCASLMLVQGLYTMDVSSMVLASPARKRMQTTIPVVLGGTMMLITYLFVTVIYAIAILVNGERICRLCNSLLVLSVMMLVMLVYIVMAYKYFAVSVAAFLLVYCCFFQYNLVFGKGLNWNIWGNSFGSFVLAAAAGLVVLMIAGFLAYLLSILIYRKPISKSSMTMGLRKEM